MGFKNDHTGPMGDNAGQKLAEGKAKTAFEAIAINGLFTHFLADYQAETAGAIGGGEDHNDEMGTAETFSLLVNRLKITPMLKAMGKG